MKQEIKKIKAGQKFKVVGMSIDGFDIGCIIEALNNINTTDNFAGTFKWIGGYKPKDYGYKVVILSQNTRDLKRFKGKIK